MASRVMYRNVASVPFSSKASSIRNEAIPAHLSMFHSSLQCKFRLSSCMKKRHRLIIAATESGEGDISQPISTEKEVKHGTVPSSLYGLNKASNDYATWDTLTGQMAGSATFAFLLFQVPQISLNFQNLTKGNAAALFAVPWMGQLVCLLGNLSLLSYFAKKREVGAMIVQAVGVVTTSVVLLQLTLAGSMPSLVFIATAVAVGFGLILNFLNYNKLLSPQIWYLWEDVITVGGLAVLPQVMWSTFDTILPPSLVPGIGSTVVALSLVILRRLKKLSPDITSILSSVSAWTATLLFMWGPVAQIWTNYINPANIRGLSVSTILLAMIGNGLMLPRALFTRDLMWFTGASWGTLLQGWAILVTMYMNKCIPKPLFWGAGVGLAFWLGMMLATDAKVYSLSSPLSPLRELFFGRIPAKSD
ncbi:hypothetical protein KP509_35G023000 [Ceratopteris richardii]|uniref:Uncharacterized protein n=1 Tax=Ceratopteris richardii TaxID=49495 RepID=A0A8T2QDT2_CERRI|nr:hypothetical protein KP509_35G023000 [Ceratopteris richardii]